MRDFMDTLRGSGIDTGGPAALSQAERMAFANQLDRYLVRRQAETQAGKGPDASDNISDRI
jgi:uncharacterized protein YaiI (UPF0178 family)